MVSERISLGATPARLKETHAENDEALAVRGDADSFVSLYRKHLRPVYNYLYARLGSREAAEDVTSVTFERAWSSIHRYRSVSSFRGWLFTIAHRALADHYRSRQAPPSVPMDTLADVLLDPTLGPEERALLAEQVRQVLRIVATLRPEQQEVIGLRFMAELRYSEIAQVLGKGEAAVKMIAYRALEEIRRRYRDVQQ